MLIVTNKIFTSLLTFTQIQDTWYVNLRRRVNVKNARDNLINRQSRFCA